MLGPFLIRGERGGVLGPSVRGLWDGVRAWGLGVDWKA